MGGVYIHSVLMGKDNIIMDLLHDSVIVNRNSSNRHRHLHDGRRSGSQVEILMVVVEAILHITRTGRVPNDIERYRIADELNIVWHHHPEITPPREVILGKGGQGGKDSAKQAYYFCQTAHRKTWIKVTQSYRSHDGRYCLRLAGDRHREGLAKDFECQAPPWSSKLFFQSNHTRTHRLRRQSLGKSNDGIPKSTPPASSHFQQTSFFPDGWSVGWNKHQGPDRQYPQRCSHYKNLLKYLSLKLDWGRWAGNNKEI